MEASLVPNDISYEQERPAEASFVTTWIDMKTLFKDKSELEFATTPDSSQVNLKDLSVFKSGKHDDFDSPQIHHPSLINERRSVLLNESWTNILNFKSKVVSLSAELVHCECLMDESILNFETRVFPKIVFDTLDVKVGQRVMVSIKSKPGSIRIDVHDGTHLFTDSVFNLDSSWDKIEKKLNPRKVTGFDA